MVTDSKKDNKNKIIEKNNIIKQAFNSRKEADKKQISDI